MRDYFEAVRDFSAAELEKKVLQGSLSTGVNACVECCDHWAKDGAVALEWYGASGERKTVTFAQMRVDSARFANYLRSRGIGAGDVVAGLLPRIPELLTVIRYLAHRRAVSALVHCLRACSGRESRDCRRRQQGEADRHRQNQPAEAEGHAGLSPHACRRRRLRREACHAINRLRAGHDRKLSS